LFIIENSILFLETIIFRILHIYNLTLLTILHIKIPKVNRILLIEIIWTLQLGFILLSRALPNLGKITVILWLLACSLLSLPIHFSNLTLAICYARMSNSFCLMVLPLPRNKFTVCFDTEIFLNNSENYAHSLMQLF